MTTLDLPTAGESGSTWPGKINTAITAVRDAADAAPTPDATSSVKGKVQLAGDLGGTAAAPTVTLIGAKTFDATTSLEFPAQPSRVGQLILHGVNDAAGLTSRNIVFVADGTMSRPGPVWVDSAGRTQVWEGWHDLVVGGGVHHAYEVKTSTDPAGLYPAVLATRFRIQSDQDQGYVAFFSTSELLIENGNANNTAFGITFNTPQSGSVIANTATTNYKAGRLAVVVDGAGVATMHLSPGLTNTTGSHLAIFRDVNNAVADVVIYKADNTNTVVAKIDAKTGAIYGLGADGVTLTKAVLADDFRVVNATASTYTMPIKQAASNLNISSGTVYAVRCTPTVSGTFSKIRFCTSSTAPVGLTNVKAGVFNAAGTLLQSTADIVASVTGGSIIVEQALGASVTVTAGTDVYLGLAYVGTSLGVKGSSVVAAMAALAADSKTGSYAGGAGALGTLGTTANGNLPWLELVT